MKVAVGSLALVLLAASLAAAEGGGRVSSDARGDRGQWMVAVGNRETVFDASSRWKSAHARFYVADQEEGGQSSSDAPAADGSSGGETSGEWKAPEPGASGQPVFRRNALSRGDFLDRSLPSLPPLPSSLAATVDRGIEPGEILIASGELEVAKAVAQAMRQSGYRLRRRKVLHGLGMILSVFRVPEGHEKALLVALRQTSPDVWMDVNHRYRPMGGKALIYGQRLIGWNSTSDCGRDARIGLVDGPVERAHPALRGAAIESFSFLGAAERPAPADHATAIAGLLVGRGDSGFGGLLPGAELHLAVVLRNREADIVDATAEKMVAALDWLVRRNVRLGVMSIGGPPNRLLELALLLARRKGLQIVAAAGNDGKMEPVYPAAYDGVVGVTAVDAEGRAWRLANRGSHVTLAAPGVDLWLPTGRRGGRYLSGTSYAAPFVAAALALEESRGTVSALEELLESASDAGKPGVDPVYGHGILRHPGCGDGS